MPFDSFKPVPLDLGGTEYSNATIPGPTQPEPPNYAPAGRRFIAWLIDHPFSTMVWILTHDTFLSTVALILCWINSIVLQGITGYSLGKYCVGLRLAYADKSDKARWWLVRPGIDRCLIRYLLHYLDFGLIFGALSPLWDPYSRTWADQAMKTVVLYDRRYLDLMNRHAYRAAVRASGRS